MVSKLMSECYQGFPPWTVAASQNKGQSAGEKELKCFWSDLSDRKKMSCLMIHRTGTSALQDHNGQVLEQLAGDIIPVGVEGGCPG